MAVWAMYRGAERSPSPSRSLIAGLVVVLALLLLPARVGDAATAPARDPSSPSPSSARDSGGGTITSGSPDVPSTTGKPAASSAVQSQGSVVAIYEDPTDPLIVIAVDSGYLTVRLRCGTACPSIRLGDYVVADGRRRSDVVFDASEVWVVAP